jgi:sugar O-acyltransferase (sialic acid O-acetyltransferase NeuD family)
LKKFTFLGRSDPSIAMFTEVMYSLLGRAFSVRVVENLPAAPDSCFPSIMEGIEAQYMTIDEWTYDDPESLVIGVNRPQSKLGVIAVFEERSGAGRDDFTVLIHPAAQVSQTAEVSPGVILNPGVVLAPFSRLGTLVTVNRNASIGHHTSLGAFTTVHPGVSIAGFCEIGQAVEIGIGSSIVDGIRIGDGAVIGAGSVVVRDIPENSLAMGVPARVVREL